MLARLVRHAPVLAALALSAPAALAQAPTLELTGGPRQSCPPPICYPQPTYCPPPSNCPAPAPKLPTELPSTPKEMTPPSTVPTDTPTDIPSTPSFSSETSASVGGSTFAYGGYIDSAIIRTQIRLRYDSAYRNNRPDRAEFFYAKCGGPGPLLVESRVDYQDINAYLEFAASNRFSGFIEVPVRFLNPTVNPNAEGISDINAGIRLGLVANADQAYTFQLRTFIPTGDVHLGLGNGHATIEPAFLVFQKLTDRLYMEAELRDWIPLIDNNYAGNVLRYGIGFAYNVAPCPEKLLIAPVIEFVGWSVLSGNEITFPSGEVQSASGDQITNAKLGVRIGTWTNSLYVGYGRALTGEVWYKDMLRVEYRLAF